MRKLITAFAVISIAGHFEIFFCFFVIFVFRQKTKEALINTTAIRLQVDFWLMKERFRRCSGATARNRDAHEAEISRKMRVVRIKSALP